MTNLQTELLKMLNFFHDICEKKQLRYYLLGGTALGAARHQGFIPWDDDVDVGIPRSDYEKFKELTKTEDFGIYRFEFPGEANDFVYPFGKMYNTNTTLIENTRYKTKRGIYIDIFPIDGIGSTKEESLKNLKPILKKNHLLSAKVCAWRKGRKLYKNLALTFMRCIPEFILSKKKLMSEIEKLSKERDFDSSLYIANTVGNYGEKEIAPHSSLGSPTLAKFETSEFYVPENYDEYLSCLYGDWRKLPPEKKRISHHDYLLVDLNKSYLVKDL